jgi:hypothetical protein
LSRLELEGELSRLRRDEIAIQSNIGTKVQALKDILDKMLIRQIHEINFEGAHELTRELVTLKSRTLELANRKTAIEREING